MPLIYLIAGEASGDALGAGLINAMKAEYPNARFTGIGGESMQASGLESLFPYKELSVMGFAEIVPHIPKFLKLLRQTVRDIESKKPDVVVTIDSPGFNFRLAGMLKKNPNTSSIKRIHYVAPSVWAYKPGRARKTAGLFDMLLAVLPFEPPYFEKEGLTTVFVGHPVLWEKKNGDEACFRSRHKLASNEQLLLMLPGSRIGEVKHHLPVFLEAVRLTAGFRGVVLAGPQVKEFIKQLVPADIIVCDIAEKYDAFSAATAAISKSGTVTLELAAYGVPMIVAHKVGMVSAWLLRKMVMIKYASLVNIAANKAIVPELLQENCTVAEIRQALTELLSPEEMQRQRKSCADAINILRADNTASPSVLAARAVYATLAKV